jgi:8-oxo-dGTP pyrophosphatase MutT (NUDIX family)
MDYMAMEKMENQNQEKIYVDWIDRVKVLQKAVIIDKDGRILALKRTGDTRRPRPNCWDLVGGRVEAGDIAGWKEKSGRGDDNDILVNALRREIKEETNLEVADIRAVHDASGFSETRGVFIVDIGYVCKAIDESKLQLSAEHADFRWVAKDEFLNMEIGDDGGLLASIIKRLPKKLTGDFVDI